MKTKAFSVNSIEQIEPHLQGFQQEGLAPNLAIVFSSIVHDLNELAAVFAKYNIDVFGASSCGEIINDEVLEESIVMMLLEMSRDAYRVNIFDGEGKTSFEVGQSVVEWAKNIYENPALMVMVSGLYANGDEVVNGIIHTVERQVPLFGGFAGDDMRIEETVVFSTSQVTPNGAVALIFDRNVIEVQGVAVSGWKGIGTPKTITKAKGNTVYSIDDESALDVYNKYLNINGDIQLAVEYPLLLMRGDGTFVIRGAGRVNDDKSIDYGGMMPEGSKVRFSMPPGSEIIDHAVERISEFSQEISGADAIVLFSCAGRHISLGPMVEDEISSVHQLWNVPLVGFFTYGEIGPVPNGQSDYHNSTLVPVIIKEK